MKIYLAASFKRQQEMVLRRTDLEAMGHKITSRWLDEPEAGLPESEWPKLVLKNYADIDAAEMIVFQAEHPWIGFLTGGRHTEMGYAKARGKLMVVIGPKENLFYHDPEVWQFDNMDLFNAFLVGFVSPRKPSEGNSNPSFAVVN